MARKEGKEKTLSERKNRQYGQERRLAFHFLCRIKFPSLPSPETRHRDAESGGGGINKKTRIKYDYRRDKWKE